MKARIVLLLALALPAFAQLTPADFAGLRDVGAPRLSPDGSRIAYTVRQPSLDDDKNHTHIWLAGFDGADIRQLTFSDSSESSPKWSADGRQLAFLSGRGNEDDLDQLWIMNLQGGEAERVTEFKGSVDDFDWSPDGKHLALIVEDAEPKVEKDKTKPPVVINRFQFKQDKRATSPQNVNIFTFSMRPRKRASSSRRGRSTRGCRRSPPTARASPSSASATTTSTGRTTGTST